MSQVPVLIAWRSEGGKEKGNGSGPLGHELHSLMDCGIERYRQLLPPVVSRDSWRVIWLTFLPIDENSIEKGYLRLRLRVI